ncbi:MAG: hypothetical protein ACK4YU_06620, partial [Paracoccus sp. (in: a-proteobacteria)]
MLLSSRRLLGSRDLLSGKVAHTTILVNRPVRIHVGRWPTQEEAMKIGALREGFDGEARVSVTPASAGHLQKLGHEVVIEAGAGARAGF